MSTMRLALIAACGFALLSGRAFAQSQNSKPTAKQQLHYATQGTQQRNHVFDNTRRPPNPAPANTVRKPSPVGQNIYSTRNNPGYKPAKPSLHINPVPSPVITQRPVQHTVVRSTGTASAPVKKP